MPDRNKYVTAAIFLVVIAAAIAGWGHSHSPAVERWCTNTCRAMHGCDLDFSNGTPRPIGPYCFIHENQCKTWCGDAEDSVVGIVKRPPTKINIVPGPY